MKIKDIMAKPVFLSPELTKKHLFDMAKKHPEAEIFIVVDKNKKFLGDIHINDLFLMFLPNDQYEDIGVELAFDLEKKFFANTAGELMRKHDVSCSPDDEVLAVAKQLAGEEVNEMPVIDNTGKVVGVITQRMLVPFLPVK